MAFRISGKFLRSVLTLSSRSSNVGSSNAVRNFGSIFSSSTKVNHLLASHRPAALRLSSSSRFSTDVALRDFLKEEIEAEKQVAKKQLGEEKAPVIPGFQLKTDEAEVTLTKTFKNEKITISFNVNDCVRPQEDAETGTMEKIPEDKEEPNITIFAEPSFRVEIEKNNQKLIFDCEFLQDYNPDDMPNQEEASGEDNELDMFNIVAVYLTSGEVTNKLYGATGDILDGTLYDHLFEYLAERGIDSKFADDLIRFATHYEHAQYVNLLQKLKEFVSH